MKRTDPISGASFIVQDDYYDAAGNLSDRVTNNRATDTYYAVDAAGRTWGTNLDFGGLGRITKYAYSPDDTVLTTTVKDASGTATVVDSSYDPLGRMTSRSVHNDGAGKPAGWWRLNETAGTAAADSSGAGQTGFLGAGVTWSGGAAKFTGSGGPIATAGPVLNTAQSYTVSAWVNLASTAGFRRTSG